MNGRIALTSVALIVGLLPDAGAVSAAVRPTYLASIEWRTADAQVIVRGKAIAIDPPENHPEWDSRHWTSVRFAVEETFKGPAREEVSFVCGVGRAEPWQWLDEQVELLLYLKPAEDSLAWTSGRRPPEDSLVLDFAGEGWRVHRLDGETSPGVPKAATMEFKTLRNREDILAAVRAGVAAVADADHAPVAYRIQVPFGSDLYPSQEIITSLHYLTVPVDDRLEQYARQWVESDSKSLRLEGVKAIRHFRSEENARLVRALLDDKDRMIRHTADGRVETVYPLAELAAQVLEEWAEEESPPAGSE